MQSIAFAFQHTEHLSEQRRSERLALTLPALIFVAGRPHRAQLYNLSGGGALLRTEAAVGLEDEVEFCCGAIRVDAIVRRKACVLVAIEFKERLSETQLREQVNREDALVNRRSRH